MTVTCRGYDAPSLYATHNAIARFDTQEEPLFVIHHITRLVSLEGSVLADELRRLLGLCVM